jgi:hypothetical protein
MRAAGLIAIAAFAAFAGGMVPVATPAELYKHVDANGKVTYTDQPLTPEETQLQIFNTTRNGDGGAKLRLAQKKAAAEAKGEAKGGKKGGARNDKGAGRAGQKKASGNNNSQAPPQPPQQ